DWTDGPRIGAKETIYIPTLTIFARVGATIS
ncbi:MAG: hypothetical protein ACI90Y_001225, partial [Polaromonas sp.]